MIVCVDLENVARFHVQMLDNFDRINNPVATADSRGAARVEGYLAWGYLQTQPDSYYHTLRNMNKKGCARDHSKRDRTL